MHDDEQDVDADLVTRLIAGQFPQWADLRLRPVRSIGTDNALYRLGDDMIVRLPRIGWAVEDVEKEQTWLPRLAPLLPAAISEPLAMGAPAEDYPWHWSVYRWLPGENPVVGHLTAPEELAADLAEFITALHRIDPTGGPHAARGVPLQQRDALTRDAIEASGELIDPGPVTVAWEAAVQAPPWTGPPVWIHADISPGNLLAIDGRLSAVIDFGALGIGDPACDLLVAWNLLPADARYVFREALQVDDATWERGRGWALSTALVALPYYTGRNPVLADNSRYVIAEVLADR